MADFYVYILFRENGLPFYVGKGRRGRMAAHITRARRGDKGHLYTLVRRILRQMADVPSVKMHEGLTEVVAFEYETALIAAIGRYPNGPLLNKTGGGEGLSGMKHSPETRARMRDATLGRRHSAETRAKISAVQRGKRLSPETRAKLRALRNTPEWRAKMSAALRGRSQPLEVVTKRSAANRGQKRSAESRARMSAAAIVRGMHPNTLAGARRWNKGNQRSPDIKAKIAATLTGLKRSPEFCAQISIRQRGRKMSPEAIEKMAASKRGRKHSPELIAKRAAALRAFYERRSEAKAREEIQLRWNGGCSVCNILPFYFGQGAASGWMCHHAASITQADLDRLRPRPEPGASGNAAN